MTTDQNLPLLSLNPLSLLMTPEGINITAGGHRRGSNVAVVACSICYWSLPLLCINAAVTTLLISWRTPTVVSFDMKNAGSVHRTGQRSVTG